MDLEQRIARLERENRRLKVTGGAVVTVLVAIALAGAAVPQEIPDEIVTRELRVVDDDGITRVRLTPDEGVTLFAQESTTARAWIATDGLTFANTAGDIVVLNLAADGGFKFGYVDEHDNPRISLDADGGLTLATEDGSKGVSVSADGGVAVSYPGGATEMAAGGFNSYSPDGAAKMSGHWGFVLEDKRGAIRAMLGVADLVTPSTGAETHYPAAVVLYDEDGSVIWRAPR